MRLNVSLVNEKFLSSFVVFSVSTLGKTNAITRRLPCNSLLVALFSFLGWHLGVCIRGLMTLARIPFDVVCSFPTLIQFIAHVRSNRNSKFVARTSDYNPYRNVHCEKCYCWFSTWEAKQALCLVSSIEWPILNFQAFWWQFCATFLSRALISSCMNCPSTCSLRLWWITSTWISSRSLWLDRLLGH